MRKGRGPPDFEASMQPFKHPRTESTVQSQDIRSMACWRLSATFKLKPNQKVFSKGKSVKLHVPLQVLLAQVTPQHPSKVLRFPQLSLGVSSPGDTGISNQGDMLDEIQERWTKLHNNGNEVHRRHEGKVNGGMKRIPADVCREINLLEKTDKKKHLQTLASNFSAFWFLTSLPFRLPAPVSVGLDPSADRPEKVECRKRRGQRKGMTHDNNAESMKASTWNRTKMYKSLILWYATHTNSWKAIKWMLFSGQSPCLRISFQKECLNHGNQAMLDRWDASNPLVQLSIELICKVYTSKILGAGFLMAISCSGDMSPIPNVT